jgi:hypothetical protein
MGWLSPYTLIRTVSIFHLSAAYFFLASPRKLVDQNVVFMLGESMRLVSPSTPPSKPNPNPPTPTSPNAFAHSLT